MAALLRAAEQEGLLEEYRSGEIFTTDDVVASLRTGKLFRVLRRYAWNRCGMGTVPEGDKDYTRCLDEIFLHPVLAKAGVKNYIGDCAHMFMQSGFGILAALLVPVEALPPAARDAFKAGGYQYVHFGCCCHPKAGVGPHIDGHDADSAARVMAAAAGGAAGGLKRKRDE